MDTDELQPEGSFDEPWRALVEMVDVNGNTVLIPIETGAVVTGGHRPTPDPHRLDNGYVRVGQIVVEQSGSLRRVPFGRYEPSRPSLVTGWAQVRQKP